MWFASVASNIGTWMLLYCGRIVADDDAGSIATAGRALVQTATTLPVFLLGLPLPA